jgi:hypothetical protein
MSGLIYERGEPAQPVGHAFLYFGHRGEPDVLATYIVVPPITIDLAKYMPPMFASTFGAAALAAPQTAFLPIPPVPEPMDLSQLLGMAELRGDDVLLAGPPPAGADPAALLTEVVAIAEAYAESYRANLTPNVHTPAEEAQLAAAGDSAQVRALMYATVSERDRLEALARELGRIRYGVEVGDTETVDAALEEMRAIAGSLPGKFRAHELIDVAARADHASVRLTQLYLDRGYRLCSEAYEELPAIEAEIALLQHEVDGPRPA